MTTNVVKIHAHSFRQALDERARLVELGFEHGDYGQFTADGCKVTLYRVGGEYELDIVMPNGAAVGCDVPVAELAGRTAQEIEAARTRPSDREIRHHFAERFANGYRGDT